MPRPGAGWRIAGLLIVLACELGAAATEEPTPRSPGGVGGGAPPPNAAALPPDGPGLGASGASDDPTPRDGVLVPLGEPPAAAVPEVTFLTEAPVIDGVLDAPLRSLPARAFSLLQKSAAGNPTTSGRFRLAYGTTFLYVHVETGGARLTYRDRAFQNGDGFHLVVGAPREGGTEEFYVVASSAVDRPEMEWSRRVIWYYNVDRLFLSLSAEARAASKASGGVLSFELLLPWTDLHPYHPWLSPEIGFNLSFVKAVGERERNVLYLVPDRFIQSEMRPRQLARLSFQAPSAANGPRTFVRLTSGNVPAGGGVRAEVATVAPVAPAPQTAAAPSGESVTLRLLAGEGGRLSTRTFPLACAAGVCREELVVSEGGLLPGGYRVEWSARSGSKGEAGLTVLPEVALEKVEARLSRAGLPPGSFSTLRYEAQELATRLARVRRYETAGPERVALEALLADVARSERSGDPVASRRGFFRRAFRSARDGTLQPYAVRLPEGYTSARTYPLLVFLHGSGSDESSMATWTSLSRGLAIEVAPRARGTSHAYAPAEAHEDVLEAIEDAARSYPTDGGKTVLTGFSMGGYGVLRVFARFPERFRALAVFSGNPELGPRWTGDPSQPSFLEERHLAAFRGIPVFVFHGQMDRNTPFERTELLVEKLRRAGADVTFVTEEGAGHEAPKENTWAAYHRWLADALSR